MKIKKYSAKYYYYYLEKLVKLLTSECYLFHDERFVCTFMEPSPDFYSKKYHWSNEFEFEFDIEILNISEIVFR